MAQLLLTPTVLGLCIPNISGNEYTVMAYYDGQSVSLIQLLSHVQLFVTPWTAACQASLSITNSQSFLKYMPIKSVMPPNHLILWGSLLLLPSIFSSIGVFSNETILHQVAKVLELQLHQSFQ